MDYEYYAAAQSVSSGITAGVIFGYIVAICLTFWFFYLLISILKNVKQVNQKLKATDDPNLLLFHAMEEGDKARCKEILDTRMRGEYYLIAQDLNTALWAPAYASTWKERAGEVKKKYSALYEQCGLDLPDFSHFEDVKTYNTSVFYRMK